MSKLHKQFISSNCRLRVTGPTAMYCKLALALLAVLIGNDFVAGQEQIPSTTTAAELWNPWTWFWPYAIATAEGYRDYYQKAQKATNELYQQVYKTNAFPWVTGNWGLPQNNPGGNSQNNQGGNPQNNQDNQNNENNQNNQNNQGGNNGQNNQGDGSGGQDKPSEDNAEKNPGEDDGQDNPTDNKPNNEDKGQEEPSQDDTTADETNQNKPGAQVQGGAQGDGAADAEVNGKIQ